MTPFTLLDYPGKTACIVWFAGCNMACSYCYNPEIVKSQGVISYSEVLAFLEKRKGLLDAVVLSGGEATRAKGIVEFAKEVKRMGYLIKLDTNGSIPSKVDELLAMRLIDYVALDFKAMKSSFFQITNSKLFPRFERVLQTLVEKNVAFEVRTTYHGDLLSTSDLSEMCRYLLSNGYKGVYYVQHFLNGSETIGDLKENFVRLRGESFDSYGLKVQLRN